MECLKILTNEDLGLDKVELNSPRIRYGARGIVMRNDGKIAIFNKTKKNEYKLPGGGIDKGEDPKVAYHREVLEETGCKIEIVEELGTIEEERSSDNFKQISYLYSARVIEDTGVLGLTEKEKKEGAKLIWVEPKDGLRLITECFDNLKASEYEDLYHTKFVVLRDKFILDYYNQKKLFNE